MEPLTLASIVNVINIIILLVLLHLYVRNYNTLKAPFTLGLIVFASFFLLHNLIALSLQFTMSSYYNEDVAGYAILIHILEMLGFATLLYVSRK